MPYNYRNPRKAQAAKVKKAKTQKPPEAHYALRTKDTPSLFVDGTTYPTTRWGVTAYNPKFSKAPYYWKSEKALMNFLSKYELERLCGKILPEVSVVMYKLEPVEVIKIEYHPKEAPLVAPILPSINPLAVIRERIRRDTNEDGARLFDRICEKESNSMARISEYKYFFRRKGAGKEALENQLPTCVTFNFSGAVKSDTDLVFARMLLGANLTSHINITKYFDEMSEYEKSRSV